MSLNFKAMKYFIKRLQLSLLAVAVCSAAIIPALAQGLIGMRPFGWPSPDQFENCKREIQNNPRSVRAYEEFAEMHHFLDNPQKSAEMWSQAIKLRLENQAYQSDLQGLGHACSSLGWESIDGKNYAQAETALKQAIGVWKLSMKSDKSGNSQYRLELDIDYLTRCYAEWGKVDEARQCYAQLIAQMKLPNDAHDNPYDLVQLLKKLRVLPQDVCPPEFRH